MRCSTHKCRCIAVYGIDKCKKHVSEYRCRNCNDNTCRNHCIFNGCGIFLYNRQQQSNMTCRAHTGMVCRYCRGRDQWCRRHCSFSGCTIPISSYYKDTVRLVHLNDVRRSRLRFCKLHYKSQCNTCNSNGNSRCISCARGICDTCEHEYSQYGLCINCIVEKRHHYLYVMHHNIINLLNSVLPSYVSNRVFNYAFCVITNDDVNRELEVIRSQMNKVRADLEYKNFMESVYHRISDWY